VLEMPEAFEYSAQHVWLTQYSRLEASQATVPDDGHKLCPIEPDRPGVDVTRSPSLN